MSVKTKNQAVKLNKVVLNNVDAVVIGVAGTKDDKRTNNPGRPVNKKSARYKRLAKQAFYNEVNSKFVKGNQFKIGSSVYKYSAGKNNELGCIVDSIGLHQCNVDYIGRTKVKCYSFTLGKKVNVELNLKTLKFVS